MFAFFNDFPDHMRIGHMGARHAHHIDQTRGNRMAGGCHIRDARGVEGGQADLGPDAPGKVQMRGAAHSLHRDHIGQRGIGVDTPPYDVDEIDKAESLNRRAISTPSETGMPPGASSSAT